MRRDLNQAQRDLLTARLREMKIRPGLAITALWQFGWMVPPIILLPLVPYLACYFVAFAVLYAAMIAAILASGDVFTPVTITAFCSLMLFSLVTYRLVARSRLQALLGIAAYGAAVMTYSIWLMRQDWAFDVGQILASVPAGALTGFIVGPIGVLVGSIIRYHRERRKRGHLTWRGMIDEARVVEAF